MGTDVSRLTEMGITAHGWDPVYAPAQERHPSDIVNLGYVLNVIEDPVERLETLVAAWRLSQKASGGIHSNWRLRARSRYEIWRWSSDEPANIPKIL